MRVRSGFVSNSSSSSFIVGFAKIPETIEEMRSLLFPDGDHREDIGFRRDAEYWTPEHVAEKVFQDLTREPDGWHDGSEASLKKVVEEIGTWEIAEKMQSFPFEKMREVDLKFMAKHEVRTSQFWMSYADWTQARCEVLDAWMTEIEAEFQKHIAEKYPDLVGLELRYFCYSDEDGEGVLEHGGTFDNVPHVRISHH